MANSADPDQLGLKKPTNLDLHYLQRKDISGSAGQLFVLRFYGQWGHVERGQFT